MSTPSVYKIVVSTTEFNKAVGEYFIEKTIYAVAFDEGSAEEYALEEYDSVKSITEICNDVSQLGIC